MQPRAPGPWNPALGATAARPPRHAADATQEVDARDVLEVLEVSRAKVESSPSIMPVDVDLGDLRGARGGRNDPTCQIRIDQGRPDVARYAAGIVAVACVVFVAVVVKRASPPHEAHAATSPIAVPSPPAAPSPPAPVLPAPVLPVAPSVPADTAAEPDTTSTSGSIRFAAPARAGWVWLDGKRLSGTSAIVTCGTHQVKVGSYGKHAVVVPCGGEVVLSR